MIRHLFQLMWNQKRKHLGLLIEVFFSFLVIFAVFSFLVYNFLHYQQPLGFDYQNIWQVSLEYPPPQEGETREEHSERIQAQLDRIGQQLRQYPEFEAVSFSSYNVPYLGSTSMGTWKRGDQDISTHVISTDPNLAEVLDIPILAGQWIDDTHNEADPTPVVINRQLAQAYFGHTNVVGESIDIGHDRTVKVIGLIGNFKKEGEFSKPVPFYFRPRTFPASCILIETRPGTDAAVEARLFDDLQSLTKNWIVQIRYLEDMRQNVLMETWVPSIIFLIISGFLIFNVALGLFGVVWQNINKRKQEIGVRRAMGSTKMGISAQLVGEVMVLATLSLALGLFFALQFPLLQVFELPANVYLIAILLSVLFIYLLVLICVYYPSRQAAQLHPAVALHEE